MDLLRNYSQKMDSGKDSWVWGVYRCIFNNAETVCEITSLKRKNSKANTMKNTGPVIQYTRQDSCLAWSYPYLISGTLYGPLSPTGVILIIEPG